MMVNFARSHDKKKSRCTLIEKQHFFIYKHLDMGWDGLLFSVDHLFLR